MLNFDAVYGAFYGHAIGDCLGMPHEFTRKRNQGLESFSEQIITTTFSSQYQGKRTTALGQGSDDTEMTAALIGVLANDSCKYDVEAAALRYMTFANFSSFIGKNTRALFHGVKTYKGYLKRRETIDENMQPNGALMRALPFALVYDPDAIVTDVNLTNPGPLNAVAVFFYVSIIRGFFLGYDIKEAYDKTLARFGKYASVLEFLNDIHPSQEMLPVNNEKKGWMKVALMLAVRAATMPFTSYREGIRWIVSLGGDTDTNGAICGAVLGARFGLAVMQSDPITQNNIRIIDSQDTSTGDFPRTEDFTSRFIITCVRKLEQKL